MLLTEFTISSQLAGLIESLLIHSLTASDEVKVIMATMVATKMKTLLSDTISKSTGYKLRLPRTDLGPYILLTTEILYTKTKKEGN